MKKNYSIIGPSGSGKTTIGRELSSRGYFFVDTDDKPLSSWMNIRTGKKVRQPPKPIGKKWRTAHAWVWDTDYLAELVKDESHREAFFCGGSYNYEKVKHFFDKIFMLCVSREVLISRLQRREPNRWTDDSYELARELEDNEQLQKNMGTGILIDGSRSVQAVADEILKHIREA